MVVLPQSFVERINLQLKDKAPAFLEAFEKGEVNTFVRHNLSKINGPILSEVLGDKVPWCEHANILTQRPSFTLDPDFHAGRYYVQESSSMVIYQILTQLFGAQKSELRMLDLCGAPGGKSTAILDYLEGNGTLIANEVIQNRVKPLTENIMKWGYNNTIVTNDDPSAFARFHGLKFDCIVVDAPCSGEGMFRKDPKAIEEWSADHVHHCAVRQKRILQDVSQSLKENGYIIYSTCTYNDEENIDNVNWMMSEFGLESISLDLDPEWGIEPIQKEGAVGYQFYPHKVNGEGYFVAVLKNTESGEDSFKTKPKLRTPEKKELEVINEWIETEDLYLGIANNNDVFAYNESTFEVINIVLGTLKVKYSGVKVGTLNKTILIPDHALALSNSIVNKMQKVALSKEDAIAFLRKELTAIPSDNKGWTLITYNGFGLGWIKNLGNRINNYLPNEWRIRMSKQ